jgi:hypothetical protein
MGGQSRSDRDSLCISALLMSGSFDLLVGEAPTSATVSRDCIHRKSARSIDIVL